MYLDFPGDALRPGCLYAADSARYARSRRPAVYAHVAGEADRPGALAVQYWSYWYYNDWNDKHEGDWEFTQVLFRATSVEQALTQQPVSVGYAQHEGGEIAQWSSDELERDGTHPVVYASERSHASYLRSALFLGRGASEGFGCDDTQEPSVRIRPETIVLPDAPTGPDDPFAWLAFDGRWGERQASPNNGPTGPAMKPQWSQPVTWHEGLRPSSFVIPGGSDAPPPVVGTFCSAVEKGSVLFVSFLASPAKVFLGLVALALVLGFLLRRTSWRWVDPLPVVSRRRAGEIVRGAATLYRRHPATFATVALATVPVAAVALLLSLALEHLPGVGTAATVATDVHDPGGRAAVAAAVAAAFWPLTVFLASAAVAAVLGHSTSDDRLPGLRTAIALMRGRAGALATGFLPVAALIGVLSLTGVGLPVAAWLAVRFQFCAQVAMLDGVGGSDALRRSGALVRGRWWHTAVVAVLVWAAVNVVGVVLGLLLLVTVTQLPLWSVTAVMLTCQVLLVPLGAIVLTLLYGDARAEHDGPSPAAVPDPDLAKA